jgi:hypothetical protein
MSFAIDMIKEKELPEYEQIAHSPASNTTTATRDLTTTTETTTETAQKAAMMGPQELVMIPPTKEPSKTNTSFPLESATRSSARPATTPW